MVWAFSRRHRVTSNGIWSGRRARRSCARGLEHRFEAGGLEEAALRALVYIRLAEGSIDERGFAVLRLVRTSRPAAKRMSLARFKEIL